MDFYQVSVAKEKKEVRVFPTFLIRPSKDIMVKGGSFYAVWDETKGQWSREVSDVARLVDEELRQFANKIPVDEETKITIRTLLYADKTVWAEYMLFLRNMSDFPNDLDDDITFEGDVCSKTDYRSKRVPYRLADGPCPSYEELISTLYSPQERAKLEWAIGAILVGDAKTIQKFIVLYGEAGSGKSTILNILQMLFEGYYVTFEAKALVGNSNIFSTEVFRSNPLVGIQHDGDLSRIEDNSKLNSIISHEEILINEKYKAGYPKKINCFLFMGTNRPVKITDAKSGIIRRLIDVHPTGNKIPVDRYFQLMDNVKFELGQIANHCVNVYRSMGKNYYRGYVPFVMSQETDTFYNFISENYFELKNSKGITGNRAWALYKEYVEAFGLEYKMNRMRFYAELKSYYEKYYERTRVDGIQVRHYFEGFLANRIFGLENPREDDTQSGLTDNTRTKDWCIFEKTESILDETLRDCPAQYATRNDIPQQAWDGVSTTLADIDTKRVHYVKTPLEHIVIDFDLKDASGKKSAELNLAAASKWPQTYGEFSKGGSGVHLHYIYDGDPTKLCRIYEEGVEIKVFSGKSSLRRRLSFCNDLPVAHISSGLPLKEEKNMIDFEVVKNEKAIRTLVLRNLAKEYHGYTTPSLQFIAKILDDAYNSGVQYDITDLRPRILAFAANSTNQAQYCMRLITGMQFKSKDPEPEVRNSIGPGENDASEDDLVFYDVEVFPNLFLVNYKVRGPDKNCIRMINPSPEEIGKLMQFKLVGFNCRRYDNHIMYARYLGYSNLELYELSRRIVSSEKRDESNRNCFFREAYGVSYTDVYDFASAANKKSLKKWEIELGIHHQELGLPWDEPVPEDMWVKVAEYCDNDVISTEAVFDHLHGDWIARQMLAKLAGMTVNDTTNTLTTRIIFGNDRNPQLVYTDLATGEQDVPGYQTEYINAFPGYEFVNGKNMFRGEDVGRGGYVWAIPGIYHNAVTFDVRGMHPHSIIAMNYFGEYTKRFKELVDARDFIKAKDYDTVSKMLDGMLAPYLNDPSDAKGVSVALKTGNNSCYGLSSASFPNAMRHPKNVNNIVALRGALFMVTLRDEIIARGGKPFHIKTDSIKLENPTKELSDFIFDFAKKYGYEFEIEHKFDKICLVNDAVYIAKLSSDDPDAPGEWTATGAQFAHPYIFKTLFSHEPLVFRDLCETKEVKASIFLDMNEDLPDVEELENELSKFIKKNRDAVDNGDLEVQRIVQDLREQIDAGHNYQFVGRVGLFSPIKSGFGGGVLLVKRGDSYNAVSNTTGYRWLESELVEATHKEKDIDMRYFRELVDKAIEQIRNFGDAEAFISDDSVDGYLDVLPWCDKEDCQKCADRDVCQSMSTSFNV